MLATNGPPTGISLLTVGLIVMVPALSGLAISYWAGRRAAAGIRQTTKRRAALSRASTHAAVWGAEQREGRSLIAPEVAEEAAAPTGRQRPLRVERSQRRT